MMTLRSSLGPVQLDAALQADCTGVYVFVPITVKQEDAGFAAR